MQASQTPTLVPLAFAANGTKNTIPEASQISITPGAASLNDGFPPLTFTPIAAGGVPPAGADFNGILNLITASIRWAHGGGRYAFSSTFVADTNVVGYPQGAVLMSADLQGSWLSLNDSNSDNPDTGAGTKWVPQHAYGVTAITGLTNANVTLTPAQAAKKRITLAGTLTANVQVIFPAWIGEWNVVNNTTGAFTVTAKTSAGTGVALAAGQQKITGDGTNIVQPAESIATATLGTQPMQLAQAVGRLLAIRYLTGSGTYTPTPGTTSIVVELLGGGGAGGGAPTTGSSTFSCGGPGGAGSYLRKLITSGFSGLSYSVGAAGVSASGATGGTGGTTTFGTYSVTGGTGGGTAGPAGSTTYAYAGGGAGVSVPTGGDLQYRGGSGTLGFIFNAVAVGGNGANSAYGSGGGGVGGAAGSAGSGFGSGGGGASAGNGSGPFTGGAGSAGVIVVYEYS